MTNLDHELCGIPEYTNANRINVLHCAPEELVEQSLFYRQDKMEESPGSTGQGAR